MVDRNYPSFFTIEEKALFQEIDKKKNGYISKKELTTELEKINIKLSDNILKEIFQKKYNSENGLISEKDFIRFTKYKNRTLKKFFQSYENKNYIYKSSFNKKRYFISEEEKNKFLNYLNLDIKEKISYNEFLHFYHNNNYLENIISRFFKKEFIPVSPFIILISGGIAGAVSRTLTAPLDRVKIIMQVSSKKKKIIDIVKKIYKEENSLAFFKGNGTNIIKIMPETAIKFTIFEKMNIFLVENFNSSHNINKLISGATAGICSQTFIYPLEITKTRLALAKKKYYRGIFDCLRKIIKYEGFKSLYKGWLASSLGIIPYASVDLTLFYIFKERYIQRYQKEPGIFVLLSMGATSGAFGQFVAYPFALVRTRLQSQGMINRPIIYNGVYDCIKKTITNESFFGLYKGLLPNYMKSIPAVSITYAVFEKCKQFFINNTTF